MMDAPMQRREITDSETKGENAQKFKEGRQRRNTRRCEEQKQKRTMLDSVCVLWCVQAEAAKQNQPTLTNQSGLH